jgi:hypothetical protein
MSFGYIVTRWMSHMNSPYAAYMERGNGTAMANSTVKMDQQWSAQMEHSNGGLMDFATVRMDQL